jgi:cysteine desulfurase/selenocysteine lyase
MSAAPSVPIDLWTNIRDEFPALHQSVKGKPLVYLDNAATVQKPRRVIEALADFYRRDNANVHRGLHALSMRATDAYEGARGRVARFLGAAAPEEIVFTRGTTESINLVASSWGGGRLRKGDVILLTEMEHHSNIVPWQLVAQRTGAQLRYVPITGDEGLLDLEKLDRMLTPDVKVFAFTHASNTLGTINPVAELCAKARAVGAITVIDGAQSAGHLPVNMRELDCDFYALSGHKMFAPTGIGALYGRKSLLENMEPYQGGGGMIEHVDLVTSRWKPTPERFEAGTPNFADAYALGVACDYIEELGRRRIAEHDQRLGEAAYARLAEIPGIRLLGPARNRGGVVSFAFTHVHAHDVVTFADEDGIALRGGHHCNQPLMRKLGLTSTARASFYVYNTEEEIAPLVSSLQRIVRFFG